MKILEQFIGALCELLDVRPERPASRVRDSATAELRRIVATLGMERGSQKGTELAAALGKNPDVVSWWARHGVRRRLEDAAFARRIDELDAALAQRAAAHGKSVSVS